VNNGILHKTSAVYKPATNGQAERVVRILKTAVKQAELTHRDVELLMQSLLTIFLFTEVHRIRLLVKFLLYC